MVLQSNTQATNTFHTQKLFLLAIVCAIISANAYYSQPLLAQMAKDFHTDSSVLSNFVTFGQIGTALGLLCIVPLADIFNRKILLLILLTIDIIALGSIALVPNLQIALAMASLIGLGSVMIPIILAFVAGMVDSSIRTRAIGIIMSGVLTGILLSRVVSGAISEFAGWVSVYYWAVISTVIAVSIIFFIIPTPQQISGAHYFSQIKGVFNLFAFFPVFRSRCCIGACVMASFTAFWTSITFLLSGSKFHFSQIQIGLFALSGVAGAFVAARGGKYLDHYRQFRWHFTVTALVIMILSFLLLQLGEEKLAILILGAILMDAAMQFIHVSNQGVVYELDNNARARIASGYMFSFATGGSIGAASSAYAYSLYGWHGVCEICILYSALALVISLTTKKREINQGRSI